jgi:hypothetical protein
MVSGLRTKNREVQGLTRKNLKTQIYPAVDGGLICCFSRVSLVKKGQPKGYLVSLPVRSEPNGPD